MLENCWMARIAGRTVLPRTVVGSTNDVISPLAQQISKGRDSRKSNGNRRIGNRFASAVGDAEIRIVI